MADPQVLGQQPRWPLLAQEASKRSNYTALGLQAGPARLQLFKVDYAYSVRVKHGFKRKRG